MNIFIQLINKMSKELNLDSILTQAKSFPNEGKGNPFISFGNSPEMSKVTKAIVDKHPDNLELSTTDDNGVTYKIQLVHQPAGREYPLTSFDPVSGEKTQVKAKTKVDRNGIYLITTQPQTVESLIHTAFPTS